MDCPLLWDKFWYWRRGASTHACELSLWSLRRVMILIPLWYVGFLADPKYI
jgi:hypothetical protein